MFDFTTAEWMLVIAGLGLAGKIGWNLHEARVARRGVMPNIQSTFRDSGDFYTISIRVVNRITEDLRVTKVSSTKPFVRQVSDGTGTPDEPRYRLEEIGNSIEPRWLIAGESSESQFVRFKEPFDADEKITLTISSSQNTLRRKKFTIKHGDARPGRHRTNHHAAG